MNQQQAAHKLWQLCYERNLTTWHYAAALVTYRVYGYQRAIEFLQDCA